MVETGGLLRVDPFSISALGRPWIDVHWLFQLGAYAVHRAGGLLGLVLAKSALLALGGFVLWRVVEREDPRLRLPFALAGGGALLVARHLLPVRPGILTLLFLAISFAWLEGFRRTGKARPLVLLPLLQVVWTNVQGLSALGPALAGAYLVGAAATGALGARRWFPFEREAMPWRPLALACAGCAAAMFVSPHGLDAALLPLELLRRITPGASLFAAEVAENIPPFVLERTAPEQIGHFKWYLAGLALSFALGRRRLLLSRLLLVAALVVLALMANRNVVLLYWLGTPIAMMNLAPALDRLRGRVAMATAALGGAAALGLAALAIAAVAREPSLGAPTPFRFPTESARVLAARLGGGKLFAPDHQGGYLIWTLHPRYRPYLDTRLVLRTADEFAEYLALLDHPERFDAFQARHGFDHVVLPTGYPDRYLGLVKHLSGSPDWTLVYTDGSEALFAYRTSDPPVDLGARATTEALLAGLAARHAGAVLTAARLHLAKLDLLLGHLDQARYVLAPMTDRGARGLLARCYLLAGDAANAETLARSLLAAHPDDVASMNLMALIAFGRGQSAEGLGWLRRALQEDPFDAEARALLERMEHP
jgi:hypothetical protein